MHTHLANAVSSVESLQVIFRVPVNIIDDHSAGTSHVEASTTCFSADKHHINSSALVELVDHASAQLILHAAVDAHVAVLVVV